MKKIKINKKDLMTKIICCLAGFIVGMVTVVGMLHISGTNKLNTVSVKKADIQEFNELQVWDKVSYHYENELTTFFDSYENVYNTYSLYNYIDNLLGEYYEKYGISAILCSGLESKNKLAEIYSIEKICSVVGDDDIDASALKKCLENLAVDEVIHTDSESETEYINKTKERKKLAVTLLEGKTDSSEIVSCNDKRYVWMSNNFIGNSKIRLFDNGFYYTLRDEIYISNLENSKFLNDNCFLLSDGYEECYIILFDRDIKVINLYDKVFDYMIKQELVYEYYYINIQGVEADSEGNISVIAGVEDYDDNGEGVTRKYKLKYNTKQEKIESISKI